MSSHRCRYCGGGMVIFRVSTTLFFRAECDDCGLLTSGFITHEETAEYLSRPIAVQPEIQTEEGT